MLSGRFDGGPKEAVIRGVAARLKALIGDERVLLVEANAGEQFGPMTMQCLTQMDVMVAFAFDDYGQKTMSKFCSSTRLIMRTRTVSLSSH